MSILWCGLELKVLSFNGLHAHGQLLYKLIVLQCTELTCGDNIYAHIYTLKISIAIKYLTAEYSGCGSPRVTVEKYFSRPRRPKPIIPTSVVW